MSAPRAGDEYDPLTDPLPQGEVGSPWFQAADTPEAPDVTEEAAEAVGAAGAEEPEEWYAPESYQRDWYAEPEPEPKRIPHQVSSQPAPAPGPAPVPVPAPVPDPPIPVLRDDETVALRTADTRRAVETPTGPGRAERRKAAKGKGRRRPGPASAAPAAASGASAPASAASGPAKPLSRVEARRAARAQKDSPAVIASRAIGEIFISFGVLLLLFVTYQLWWTNIRAGQQADQATNKIQDDWAKGGPVEEAFEPGQGFAIMHIPKLDVVVPVAEGISKPKVLDRGMVGHYGEGKLKTAMPADRTGNFAVAGHRNTHGEPFRYINRLKPGDPIVVETQDAYYTYKMASILPQTSPSNVGVIGPVPPGSGFTEPGRYITLTTCTPEFTSTYRMIVWGKMVEERPRSKGKPDALVG